MEKPFAVNKITVTEKVFNEAALPVLREKYNRLAFKVGGVLIGLTLLISMFTERIKGGPVMLSGETVVIAAVICYIRFALLSAERKRAYQQMYRSGTPERETVFYSGSFHVHSDDEREDIFDYEDVASARQTKNLLILTLKEGKEVILDRGGFSKGNEDAVLGVFLRK